MPRQPKLILSLIKNADGFLARDAESVYRDFALEWFKNNEEEMSKEGVIIPPGVSDEWKISMVLASREKGGMGASVEINNPEYKSLRDKMDKIGTLRADIKKDQIPPETPFLLLNYLQRKFEDSQGELVALQEEAAAGDRGAETFAASKENELKELFLLRKEIASKIMNEDLMQTGEQRLYDGGFPGKATYVDSWLESKKKEIRHQKREEIVDKEYQEFMQLPEKQRKKYQNKLGQKLETPHIPGQTEEEFQKANRNTFHAGIRMLASKELEDESAFYGLLKQGYKPHEAKRVGWPWNTKVVVPNKNGGEDKLTDFIMGGVADIYNKDIESQARKELEDTWDAGYAEEINTEIEKRIKELAESPEVVEGGIEKVYQRARERIITEYMKKQLEKQPKTKDQIAVVEKKFKETGKEKEKKKDINNFMSDVLFKKGRLEELGDNFDDDDRRAMGGFLRDWGVKADINTTAGITKAEYLKARKTPVGFFTLMMKVVERALNPVPVKKRKRKTK